MSFTPVTYTTGSGPGIDGPACNAWQTQYSEAINSFNHDLFTPFVLNGYNASKDGTTPTKLNIAGGSAYLKQSADNSLRNRAAAAQSVFTTSNPSTTLYVDLNSDGSISFHTTHSTDPNYLPLATVTTDSSSNIATVTDTRTLNTTLLPTMIGVLAAAGLIPIGTHNNVTAPTISVGNGAPSSLAANEVYIQLS